jgi:hypothetical protein
MNSIRSSEIAMSHTTRHTLLALLCAALISCGGGGGTSAPPIGGIQGSGIALGVITGFGSIFVNGIEFSTSGAQIRIEDQSGTESQLKIGQVVLVRGRIDSGGRTGTANSVDFNDNVEGPIDSLSIAAATFRVLGQTVRVTGSTLFDSNITPASIDGLSNGLVVEVSGLVNAAGETVATRIERKAAGGEFEITGAVRSLNTANSTFSINAQLIDYSAATISNGTLADGRIVEVKGTTLLPSGALRARTVELENGIGAANGDQLEIEGLVTRFASNTDFDVSGQRITTDGTTQFVTNGLTLALNIKVEVEGSVNASGVLVAKKVELKLDNSLRITATVDSVDAATNSLRVLGVAITTNAATEFEDKSNLRISPLRIGNLRTGDYVEVRGFEGSTANTLIAAILERRDLDTRVELQGPARNLADPNVTVLGLTINLQGVADFRDANDGPINRAQFFTQAAGRVITLRGRTAGATVIWERAEIEN